MDACVIGCGYVGLVNANGMAFLGNKVMAVDRDEGKISSLKEGQLPIYEPQLLEMHRENIKKGKIEYTTDLKGAVGTSQVVFLCVDTPCLEGGGADLSSVFGVVEEIGAFIEKGKYCLLVIKSTVSVGTCRKISDLLEGMGLEKSKDFDVVSNPEFFREGKAVDDFFHPDRIILGFESDQSKKMLESLYMNFLEGGVPFLFCNFETAELLKYASNSFLGVKISFINEMAQLCEKLGVDIDVLVRGLGMDRRINPQNFHPGPGYGGPCLPKDAAALLVQGRSIGTPLRVIEAAMEANRLQRSYIVDKIRESLGGDLSGKCLGVLGLAFKANSDDVRDSAALDIIRELSESGISLQLYDPEALEKARGELGELKGLHFCESAYEAVTETDAIVILTEWKEFLELDYKTRVKDLVKCPVVIDSRNVLRSEDMGKWGYTYRGMGRGMRSW